jgi:hypothetical protein
LDQTTPSVQDQPQTKRCPNCRQTYELKGFSRSNSRKDGRQGWCRGCVREQLRLSRKNYLPGPKRKPRKKHARHHVYAPEYPLVLKQRLRGQTLSSSLLEVIVIYLDNSTFSLKEIAWRCGVHERTVLKVYRDVQTLNPEWVRVSYHNYTYQAQARFTQRRLSSLQAMRTIRSFYGSHAPLVLKIKDLRQQRQGKKGRKRKECRKLDISA